MINVDLMINHSENNSITKSTTVIVTLTSVLKDSTDIVDPIILISNASDDVVSSCNYVSIQELKRKYFVTGVKSVRNGLWEMSLHVDVLSTYEVQIKEQVAVLKRQENVWNMYLDDGIFKTYQNPDIVTKAFPSGFTTQSFILAVAGG